MTRIPCWTLAPVPGEADHEQVLPAELPAAVNDLATELGVQPSTLLLAAHARVVSVLSGEGIVTVGRVADDRLASCRTSVTAGSWRHLVDDIAAAPADAVDPAAGSGVETVVDENGIGADLPEGVLLAVGWADGCDRLRLRYRTEAIDAGYADRLAGYHVAALESLVADPDADPAARTLVSGEEICYQVAALAGPDRALPDRRVHELFEDRVRAHPREIAAVQGDRAWTYAQLNTRANRLGGALLARGLEREDVVAVVTERNLEWLAAVLGVVKAGGAYLPVDPNFPADRIATILRRSGCRLVVTQSESAGALDAARAALAAREGIDVDVLDLELLDVDLGDADNLGVAVGPDQLAYLYFTSGSTGEPKGAMCEHAGLLNHVLAKVDDLGIGPGDVVAQTAPQCFDISLWQLVAALVAGGRTLIVEQETILDVERFVDTIERGAVAVIQLVPSYLEAVLGYLDTHPRPLPHLRCLSATGEALKAELVERWFATGPGVRLVNAYGLTETSDDTNHEVMDAPPAGGRVPLGRPIPNVSVYVVDEDLIPVPLGVPGEIVFSGVCVGRGYINDPERTRRAYLPDPHRPGQRLYRSGDLGRWLPDGKLDFLGRRDHQVKISGFRIEIGEIEDALTRVPGVRDGAVVVTDRPDRGRHLVGFYSAERELDPDYLRERLGHSLPAYMVPRGFHHCADLPLTANGKIDRAALLALAAELDDAGQQIDAPRNPTEARLARAWAVVLGVPVEQIGRRDHFFDRGGTSLAAVKLAIALDRAVSLRDLLTHPVLADLAALVDGGSAPHDTPAPPSHGAVTMP